VQEVASKPTVPNIPHQPSGQRERSAEAGASPFAMLLDETTTSPPPARNNHQCSRPQSNASSSCHEARPSQRTDTERTADDSDAETAAPVESEAADADPDVEASAPIKTEDGDEGDPAADVTLPIDPALAAAIDAPAPPQPAVATVIPTAADLPPTGAADAPVDIDVPAISAATTAPGSVPPSVPDAVEPTVPPPPSADAAASAADASAGDVPEIAAPAAPQAPTASNSDPANATAATNVDAPATSDAALASATDEGDASSESRQASQLPPTPPVQRQASQETASVQTRSTSTTDTATTTTPPQLPPDAAVQASQSLDQANPDAAPQPEHAEASGSESSEPVSDTAEHAPRGRPLSDFVQANKPTPDNLSPAHQAGRDFGQSVAATAHTLHAADATNPAGQPNAATTLVSAPVPIDSLAVAIAARAQGGSTRFEIRLDPPELGRIDVRLDIDRSGQVTSRLVVERAETLDVLRRDAHQLERALQDAGLKTSDNALQFSLRDQGFADRHDRNGPDGSQIRVADPEVPATEGALVAYGMTLRGGSGVDIRV
jgi:flagellar hook-length control protein FliK